MKNIPLYLYIPLKQRVEYFENIVVYEIFDNTLYIGVLNNIIFKITLNLEGQDYKFWCSEAIFLFFFMTSLYFPISILIWLRNNYFTIAGMVLNNPQLWEGVGKILFILFIHIPLQVYNYRIRIYSSIFKRFVDSRPRRSTTVRYRRWRPF